MPRVQNLSPQGTSVPTNRLLQVVATPIGNLGDLSRRMIEALTQATEIFCEDTRRTRVLLSAIQDKGLGTLASAPRLTRMDAWKEREQGQNRLEEAPEGARIVLVSDAGTPGINDPGSLLVQTAHELGYRVEPIPGPCAVTTFLSVAGITWTSYEFAGFFPRETADQVTQVKRVIADPGKAVVWFESPKRLLESIETIQKVDSSLVCVAGKELTKRFERFFRGTISKVYAQLRTEIEREGELGEWIFLIQAVGSEAAPESDDSKAQSEVATEARERILDWIFEGPPKTTELVGWLQEQWGLSKNEAYAKVLKKKKKSVDD